MPLGLGSDTGCSIRLPAAWCGLVGHKPTHGAVQMDGVTPLAPSLDAGGVLVRDVADTRLALAVLTGHPLPEPRPVTGILVGIADVHGVSAAIAGALRDAAGRVASLGDVRSTAWPWTGVQVVGRPGDDARVLDVAAAVERPPDGRPSRD